MSLDAISAAVQSSFDWGKAVTLAVMATSLLIWTLKSVLSYLRS